VPRVTVEAVNQAIAAAGGQERLWRAPGGRFWLYGGDSPRWPETLVYVSRLSSLSLEGWVAEWRRLAAAATNR